MGNVNEGGIRQALAWINVEFDVYAEVTELEKGRRFHSRRCPLARTLKSRVVGLADVSVTERRVYLLWDNDDEECLMLPRPVAIFVQRFERGEYPELYSEEELRHIEADRNKARELAVA